MGDLALGTSSFLNPSLSLILLLVGSPLPPFPPFLLAAREVARGERALSAGGPGGRRPGGKVISGGGGCQALVQDSAVCRLHARFHLLEFCWELRMYTLDKLHQVVLRFWKI